MLAQTENQVPQNDFMANNPNYKIIFQCDPKYGGQNHNYMAATTNYRTLPLPVPVLHPNIALPVPSNEQLLTENKTNFTPVPMAGLPLSNYPKSSVKQPALQAAPPGMAFAPPKFRIQKYGRRKAPFDMKAFCGDRINQALIAKRFEAMLRQEQLWR
jgi:hypothetical protein